MDQILLFCFHYDPATGKYGAVAMNMVRFAGAGFALIGGAVPVRSCCGAICARDRRISRRVG